jgi:hypothetical protein
MDDDVGVGTGPSERAPDAGADGPAPTHWRRMSARRKRDAVLRLLRGEDLELVSRGLEVTLPAARRPSKMWVTASHYRPVHLDPAGAPQYQPGRGHVP